MCRDVIWTSSESEREAPGVRSDPGGDNIVTICGVKTRDTWQGRVPAIMTRHIRQMRRREEELSSSYVPTHCHLCLSKQGWRKETVCLLPSSD